MPRAGKHALCCAQERAEKLLGGLGGEQQRWTAAAAQLRANATRVVGDALLSAAAMAYLGPFTPTFRRAQCHWEGMKADVEALLPMPCPASTFAQLKRQFHAVQQTSDSRQIVLSWCKSGFLCHRQRQFTIVPMSLTKNVLLMLGLVPMQSI